MLIGGLAFAILGNLGMVFATDLTGFLASRACLGLGAGAFAPAVRRLVILSDPDRAGERLGLMASFDMAGFISGPVLASILYEAFGLRAAFGALVLMLFALIVPVLRVPFDEAAPSINHERRPLRMLLSLAPIRGVLICTLAFYTTVGVFEAIWAVFLDDLGASQRYIGATLSIFAVPMLIFPAMAGRLAQRVGPLRVAAVSIGFAIPCMLLYGYLTGLYVLAVLVLVHAVADSFTMPSLQIGIALSSPREHLASGQGLVGAAGQLTAALTALVSGVVYGAWGPEALFGGGAAIMTVLLAVGLYEGASLLRSADPANA
jgi:predicted MFS family arabinose efflux permease